MQMQKNGMNMSRWKSSIFIESLGGIRTWQESTDLKGVFDYQADAEKWNEYEQMEKFNFYWITWRYSYLTRVNRFEGSLWLSSRCRKMEWIWADGKVQFLLNHLVLFVLDKSQQICREFWLSSRCRKMEWIWADGKVQFLLNHLVVFVLDKSKQICREFIFM